MKKAAFLGLGLIGVVFALGLWVVFHGLSVIRTDNGIRNQFKANTQKVTLVHDEMWKDISQKTQLSDEYKGMVIAAVNAVAQGRQGGSLFKSIQEAAPTTNIDTSIIKEIMATVEGKRHELTEIQNTLLQLQKEDNDLRSDPINGLFLSGREELEVKLITSSRTRNAQETGVDDDVSLRGKSFGPIEKK